MTSAPMTPAATSASSPPSPLTPGTWRLGELTVRRIGFGAMRLPAVDPDRAVAVLRRAVERGVNHIDTAAFYFSPRGSANELIHRALAPYPEDLVIATKVWPGRDARGEWVWATPDQLRGQVEENLRQLGRDHLDLVNLRVPRSRANASIAEHFGALAELRAAGLVRHLGVSHVAPEQLAEARAIAPVVCVQNQYGAGAPEARHAFADACGEQGIAFVPYFAIAGTGAEAGATDEPDERVRAVARAHGVSPARVRLAWTLHRGAHVLAIPGTGNPDHLDDNLAAGALRLTPEEVALLR